MDVVTLLTAQHAEIESLLDYLRTANQSELEEVIFALADHLTTHAGIEDRLVYVAAKAEDTAELLAASAADHAAHKRMLADLFALDSDLDRAELDARIAELSRQIREAHHHEETLVFPLVRETLGADRCVQLGAAALAIFESPDEPAQHAIAA